MTHDDEIGHDEGLKSGRIRFLDHFIPRLRDGEYEIRAHHSLSNVKEAGNEDKDSHKLPDAGAGFDAAQRFTVRGPRFDLAPTDIHMCVPPNNHSGQFEEFLPNIVLTKRGLPWERKLHLGDEFHDAPWMALLVLRADQIDVTPEPKGLENPTRSGVYKLTDILSGDGITPGPPTGVLGPHIALSHLSTDEHDAIGTMKCHTIDISTNTFEAVVPNLAEAKYLTHIRQVDSRDKEITGHKDAGWFSIVVAKGFPKHDKNYTSDIPFADDTTPFIAHLVSLEGFEHFLHGGDIAWPAQVEKLRMVSLARWNFSVMADPSESFADLMNALVKDAGEKGENLRLRLPGATKATPDEPEGTKIAKNRILNGYSPLSYRTRPGAQSFAWYRGPLAPSPVPKLFATGKDDDATVPPPTKAAEGYVYCPISGVFDLTYGVAFSTGRSLALADSVFSKSVVTWRRAMHRLIDTIQGRIGSKHFEGLYDARGHLSGDLVNTLTKLIEDKLLTQSFMDHLLIEMAHDLLPEAETLSADEIPDAKDHFEAPDTGDLLRDLLKNDDVKDALAGLPKALPSDMILWLAERALLRGVPFHHLVPTADMLPVNSIRFFNIDQNWLCSFVDGALSVGLHSSRDTALYQLMRGVVMAAVKDAVHQLRAAFFGDETLAGSGDFDGFFGFLMRSALVSGWPGLEIKAYDAPESKGKPINILRLERLSPDLMLVIFPQAPATIEMNEPREGLSFGFEVATHGEDVFVMRHIVGTRIGKAIVAAGGADRTVSAIWSTPQGDHPNPEFDKARILDIAAMVEAVKASVTTNLGDDAKLKLDKNSAQGKKAIEGLQAEAKKAFGSGAFAMNLIKVPEQMLFENLEAEDG